MHPAEASCDPLRIPPPWPHSTQASTNGNNDSQATLCTGSPRRLDSSGCDSAGVEVPVSSQATALSLRIGGPVPDLAEKPLATPPGGRWFMGIVHSFTPSWYSITMATGMAALLLHALPYQNRTIAVIYTAIFVVNVFLFIAITIFATLRYMLYPQALWMMLRHPVESHFLGCCPMGLTTVINMFIFVCIDGAGWGQWASNLAWVLWWIDVVMALACSCLLPFLLMHVHQVDLASMTAIWLLPAATPIVTASNGAAVAAVMSSTNPQNALRTLMVSYVLWGVGFPMAVVMLGIYLYRLAMHKLPPREAIVTVFIPVGPLGQASFTIMNLGKTALGLLPKTGSIHPLAGDIFYVGGFATAIILWGFGLVWLVFAIASVTRFRIPFNMGWWGFTFPAGVYVLATLQLGVELPSAFFDLLGTVLAVVVILVWFCIAVITLQRGLFRHIRLASCLPKTRRARRKTEVSDRV